MAIDDQMELNIVAAVFGKTVANLADAGYWKDEFGNPRAPESADLYALIGSNFGIMTYGSYPIVLYGDINNVPIEIGGLTTYFNKYEIAVEKEFNIFDSSFENISYDLFEIVTSFQVSGSGITPVITENLIGDLSTITKVDMNASLKLKITIPANYQLISFQILTKDIDGLYTVPLVYQEVEGSYVFSSEEDFKVKVEIREKYEVKFFDEDNIQIGETQTIYHGNPAIAPANIEKDGYNFNWDQGFAQVISNLNIHPVYTPITITL